MRIHRFMKVLQINAVNNYGSTGRNCAEIAQFLEENNNVCITAYSVGKSTKNSVKISSTFEQKMHSLLSRIFGLQGYFSPISTYKLKKYIMKFRPDVVHLNNMHASYINIKELLLFLGKNKIPVVVTLHDCWLFTGKCTHYKRIECYKWIYGCNNCPQLKEDHKSWFFDHTKKMWDDKYLGFRSIEKLAVIGVSDWITNEARKSVFFEHALLHERIYNWVNLETFYYRENNLKSSLCILGKKVVLGVASVWNEKKGLSVFLNLAKRFGNDCVVVLIGKMPQSKHGANVVTIGAVSNERELADYYSIADVFLQLSQEETFGKVVAESLACGTPVITNKYTANPELIDSTCGIVLEDSDIESIYSACKSIFEKGKGFYQANCVDRAKKWFSAEKNIPRYVEVYLKMLERG